MIFATACWGALALLATGWLAGRLGAGLVEAMLSPWAFQFWIAFGVLVLFLLFLRRWFAATIALALFAWCTAVILPDVRTTPSAAEGDASGADADRGRIIRLLHVNVLCTNPPTAEALDWLAAVDADVILVQEMSPEWATALTPRRAAAMGSCWLPHPTPAGMGLISRYPLRDVEVFDEEGGFPSIFATVEAPDAPFRLLAVHPWPPAGAALVRGRNEMIERIAAQAARSPRPTVVLGDLNETPWGSGMRALLDKGGLVSARRGFGRLPTWPTRLPRLHAPTPSLLMIPIDHCLVSPDVRVRSFEVGPNLGSDHLPIVVEIDVAGTAGNEPREGHPAGGGAP